MKSLRQKWKTHRFPGDKRNKRKYFIVCCIYLSFIVIGIAIARGKDENSLFEFLMLTMCYVMLMTSPVTIGKTGTIISALIISSSFFGMFRLVWIQRDQHYLMIYAFNAASLISLVVIDFLYRKSNDRAKHFQAESITDGMTGLFNRRYFETQLDYKLKQYKRDRNPVSLIIADVDCFKDINDSMGHDMGDQVLQGISSIIKRNIRETDIPCRIGGDEFAVILSGCKRIMVERVITSIQNDLPLLKYELSLDKEVTLSVGGALSTDSLSGADELFKKADKALYFIKENGRNGYHIGNDSDVMASISDALLEINS